MDINDLLAIHNLLGRYAHIMDAGSRGLGSWDDLGLIFTEDAVFDFSGAGGGKADGLAAIIAVMAAGVHPSGHHFSNPVIEVKGADLVTCLSKIITIGKNGLANTGHYTDHIIRTERGWRINNRAAVVYFATSAGTE